MRAGSFAKGTNSRMAALLRCVRDGCHAGPTFLCKLHGPTTGRLRGPVAMRLSNRLSWHGSGLLAAMAGLLSFGPLAGQTAEGPPAKAKVELNDQNYAEWRKHILPDTGELA